MASDAHIQTLEQEVDRLRAQLELLQETHSALQGELKESVPISEYDRLKEMLRQVSL